MKDKVRPWVTRIYGPYTRKDGRKHVILMDDGKRKQTVSYPKWLTEQRIGRLLLKNETVDHINKDFRDNSPSNLQVLSRSKHAKIDAKRVKKFTVICVWCETEFKKSARRISESARCGKSGPFCSKSCSGKYGAELQNNRIARLDAQVEIPVEQREYFSIKDKN